MHFILMIEGNEDVSWPDWIALADACERLGYHALFRSDHYLSVFAPAQRDSTDAWTLLAALAARTRRIRLGTLVSPVTFRHPAILAKTVVTADHISGGRIELGLGAGWYEREHDAHGLPFPAARERFDLLAEQIQIIHGLFTEPGFTHHGPRYRLTDCPFLPAPLQRPHPPIILGGKAGARLADLVARHATEFNSNQGSPATCRERFERVRAAAERRGRNPESIRTSVMTGVVVGATPAKYRALLRQTAEWMHTDPQALLDAHGSAWVLGTPEQAAERLAAFAAVGVERVMLQHNLHRDLDTVELLAQEVFPRVLTAPARNRAGRQQARSTETGVR